MLAVLDLDTNHSSFVHTTIKVLGLDRGLWGDDYHGDDGRALHS